MVEDLFHLQGAPLVSLTQVVHLELWISPLIFVKIQNGPNGILRGLGERIHEKNRSRKSCDTLPLTETETVVKYYLLCFNSRIHFTKIVFSLALLTN